MADSQTELVALPTRIDRYPAKMISRLASSLVERFAKDADHLVDPFCGSGAVLRAGGLRGIPVTGLDVNPFGVLLSGVKLHGFDVVRANRLCEQVIAATRSDDDLPIAWDMKDYWFTPAVVRKFERIRYAARESGLCESKAGRAVLLAIGLAVRPCSRADQRSPKPFISKNARANRAGKHFDPGTTIRDILGDLAALYGGRPRISAEVHQIDLTATKQIEALVPRCSHVITSPPYVNAQDYFRNSKLELYMLEGLLPFAVMDIIHRFIGTERGLCRTVLEGKAADARRRIVPELEYLERHRSEQAIVLHHYLDDMQVAFSSIKRLLRKSGTLVVVCGDNLIGGRRIRTWEVLNAMLAHMGFTMFESFGDRIRNRAVAPRRCGHKGLIKQEIVSAFRLS